MFCAFGFRLKSESRFQSATETLEVKSTKILDLETKLNNARSKATETQRLKDELDEYRHLGDKLTKSEALVEKYKKKIEGLIDEKKGSRVCLGFE